MVTTIDATSPLYLHPSDGNNFQSIEKLQGSSNFRSWKRSMEIALESRRKLGFVTGTLVKDSSDTVKAEAWDTCNNMIISWILGSVSESIRKSILKYKLNKELYDTKQQSMTISEYYTQMKAIWEELESLNVLPSIGEVNAEVAAFLTALGKQNEEQKLFQFLNGLDDAHGAQRSQILMMKTLPSVETTCSFLEQEE
uniref:Retrotransposon Copia-like N-terminal domain-containing protein n=1 Tax=Chenopodium quinoa TaxID=63459 RepID=A0A803KUG8_CHEQI